MSDIDPIKDAQHATTGLPVLILAHSAPWQAALKRSFQRSNTIWALDENDLVAEAILYPIAAIVLELSSSRIDQLANLQPLFWPRRRIFVVGDDTIRGTETSLRNLGVVDVFYAPGNLNRLVGLVERHNRKHQGPPVPLEIQIEHQLPWS